MHSYTPTLGRLKREGHNKVMASLGYRASSKPGLSIKFYEKSISQNSTVTATGKRTVGDRETTSFVSQRVCLPGLPIL